MNCGHAQVRQLTPEVVNTASGLFLHRFNWLTDDVIGALPMTWNYLEGWHTAVDCQDPRAVHFTRGGPWFDEWRQVEFGREWLLECESLSAMPNSLLLSGRRVIQFHLT